MALFKCQACGAPLEVKDGTVIAFCPYCGMKQSLPKDPVTVQVMSDGTSVDSLLKRAFMFLEDGAFEKANEYCDKVLDIDPENARAYLGKLMADFRVNKKEDLAEHDSFGENDNYKKILRFGDEGLISELKGYLAQIKFFKAIERNDADTVKALLKAGADVDIKNQEGRTALWWSARCGNTEIANILLDAGADINASSDDGVTALMAAASGGRAETAKLLLKHGAYVNAQARGGWTALMSTAAHGHVEIFNALLNAGADVNVKDGFGETALMRAAMFGETEIVELLLKHGAEVNAKSNIGWTALMKAAMHGRTEIANKLLNDGADVNAKDNGGRTALMFAASGGHTETAKLLLKHGADVNAENNDGKTALMIAEEKGHTDIVNVLTHKSSASAQASGCMTLILQALTAAIIISVLAMCL